MQVGRVVFILTEQQSDMLLSILEGKEATELKRSLENARKTVFIDDLRPDKIGSLPD
jgi:hypothetical protein